MGKILEKRIFNIILVFTILGEFFVPWVLKHFYKGYDSTNMVMSALGSLESPVRYIYNLWLIWLGIFLMFTASALFNEVKNESIILAVLMFVSIAVFAAGAGVISGLFSVNESKQAVTFASEIHGAGAAIGFMTLLFFPLLDGIFQFKNRNRTAGFISIIAFILSMIFFICFIMGDKEAFKDTIISYEGMWERLTLAAMYIPFLYRGISKLIKK